MLGEPAAQVVSWKAQCWQWIVFTQHRHVTIHTLPITTQYSRKTVDASLPHSICC